MPTQSTSIEVVAKGQWSRELFDRVPTTDIVPPVVKTFVQFTATKHSRATALQEVNMMWNRGFVLRVGDFVVTPRMITLAWPVAPLP